MTSILMTVAAVAAMAAAPASASERHITSNPQIDYQGFVALGSEVAEYRLERLVNLDTFNRMAAQPDTVILDTRSAAAFQSGHISGAVNLPFSDFTEDKLAAVIGDKDRPILIYCNNNFSDNLRPVRLKSAPLALNIPTFINLFGYGYKNIHELADVVSIGDPQVAWKSAPLIQTP